MPDTNTTQKVYSLIESDPTALVIHCSDPRFQKAFKEFINSELGLKDGDYVPLIVSGGTGPLSEPFKFPKEFKFMKERIEFFLGHFHKLRHIILINHEDCKYYEALKKTLGNSFLSRAVDMIERQKVDLQAVTLNLVKLLGPELHGELYYARFADELRKSVVFDRILV